MQMLQQVGEFAWRTQSVNTRLAEGPAVNPRGRGALPKSHERTRPRSGTLRDRLAPPLRHGGPQEILSGSATSPTS
jgi:hypothetical protein